MTWTIFIWKGETCSMRRTEWRLCRRSRRSKNTGWNRVHPMWERGHMCQEKVFHCLSSQRGSVDCYTSKEGRRDEVVSKTSRQRSWYPYESHRSQEVLVAATRQGVMSSIANESIQEREDGLATRHGLNEALGRSYQSPACSTSHFKRMDGWMGR